MRACVSLLLLGLYLVGSQGVLPSPRVFARWLGTLREERYPCEECGCGCASAYECWTKCCCHTERQRLVWAIENGVLPPSGVEFDDEQWIAAANEVKSGSAHCGLCVAKLKSELRRGIAARPACEWVGECESRGGSSCCEAKGPERVAGGSSCCAASGPKRASWPRPSMSALSCKGIEQLLVVSLPPAPPVRIVVFLVPEPVVFVPERPKDVAYPSRTLDVPEPPPRA